MMHMSTAILSVQFVMGLTLWSLSQSAVIILEQYLISLNLVVLAIFGK